MSKSTYFTGQPVYSLVIKLLDKAKIQQISQETLGSERYVKRLTGWKHFFGHYQKEKPKSYSKGLRDGFFCCFEVYRTAIF